VSFNGDFFIMVFNALEYVTTVSKFSIFLWLYVSFKSKGINALWDFSEFLLLEFIVKRFFCLELLTELWLFIRRFGDSL